MASMGAELVPSSYNSSCALHRNATLSFQLPPKTSCVGAEIRWYKEKECICLCRNGHVRVATNYEGRLDMLTEELGEGKVSLILRDMRESDAGNYMCEVIHGDTLRGGLRINYSSYTEKFAIYPITGGSYVHDEDMETMETSAMNLGSQLIPSYDQATCLLSEDAILSCEFKPQTSAITMEIMWFKGTGCICLYRNGKVKEGVGYEGRISLCLKELAEGKISLKIKGMTSEDAGNYMCQVNHREHYECAFRAIYSPYATDYNLVFFPMPVFSITDEEKEKMKQSAVELEKPDQVQFLTRKVENYEKELKEKDDTIAHLNNDLRKCHEIIAMLQESNSQLTRRLQQQDEPHSTCPEGEESSSHKRRSSADGARPSLKEGE